MPSDDKNNPRERFSIFNEDDALLAPKKPSKAVPSQSPLAQKKMAITPRNRNISAGELQQIGEASGFRSRDPSVKPIDGRSARATNRTKQTNMKVTPEVNRLLIERVHKKGFPSIGAYVEFLLYQDIAND